MSFGCCTLRHGFFLRSAELPYLNLRNCKTEDGITADGLRVQGNVFLRKLESKGGLRFLAAQIGGSLDCSGATLTAGGDALSADRAKIAGGVFLGEKFSCSGEIRFLGAQIGSNLDCSGATLTAEGYALSADGADIAGRVLLREKFSSSGTIRLLDAQIGGYLDCTGATLTAKGDALIADRANITRDVFLREKFSSAGKILFHGTKIGGDLICAGARIRALACEHMGLHGNLIWVAIRDPENSFLDLLGASLEVLRDDTASWPAPGNLVVKGLEYRDLAKHDPSTEEHLSASQMAPQRPLDAGERVRAGSACRMARTASTRRRGCGWRSSSRKRTILPATARFSANTGA